MILKTDTRLQAWAMAIEAIEGIQKFSMNERKVSE